MTAPILSQDHSHHVAPYILDQEASTFYGDTNAIFHQAMHGTGSPTAKRFYAAERADNPGQLWERLAERTIS